MAQTYKDEELQEVLLEWEHSNSPYKQRALEVYWWLISKSIKVYAIKCSKKSRSVYFCLTSKGVPVLRLSNHKLPYSINYNWPYVSYSDSFDTIERILEDLGVLNNEDFAETARKVRDSRRDNKLSHH